MLRLNTRFVHLLVALCLGLNGLAWAGHVDMPAPTGEIAVDSVHAHVDSGKLVTGCDHCCHAGAHLVALASDRGFVAPVPRSHAFVAVTAARIAPASDPPFIPPIT